MNTSLTTPPPYGTAGTLMMISGLLNVITAFVWVAVFIWVCVGIIWVVPLGMGAYQAYVGYTMTQGPQRSGKIAAIVGIVAGLFNFNPFPAILAIVSLVNLNKPEVAEWIESSAS